MLFRCINLVVRVGIKWEAHYVLVFICSLKADNWCSQNICNRIDIISICVLIVAKVASKVDIPLIPFIFIPISRNVVVGNYKIGVTTAIPRLDLKRASIKSAIILVIGGWVELKLVLLTGQVNVLQLDLIIVMSVPELRVIGVLVFIIWDPFQYTITFG